MRQTKDKHNVIICAFYVRAKFVSGEICEVLFDIHVKLGFALQTDTNFSAENDVKFRQNSVNSFGLKWVNIRARGSAGG
jgi:hypothetical protein